MTSLGGASDAPLSQIGLNTIAIEFHTQTKGNKITNLFANSTTGQVNCKSPDNLSTCSLSQ